MENKYCSTCGAEMTYKKGVKKETGKPWAGWFCSDRSCDSKPEWVNLKQVTAQRTQISPNQGLTNTLTDITNRLKKLELMVIKIGKMMKSQLPEAPEDAHIPIGEPPIPGVEDDSTWAGERPDYDF